MSFKTFHWLFNIDIVAPNNTDLVIQNSRIKNIVSCVRDSVIQRYALASHRVFT